MDCTLHPSFERTNNNKIKIREMKQNLLKSLWLIALLLVVGNASAQQYAPTEVGKVNVYYINQNGEKTVKEMSFDAFDNSERVKGLHEIDEENWRVPANAMAVASSETIDNQKIPSANFENVIIEANVYGIKVFVCRKFTLTDGEGWYAPVAFTAEAGSYSRTLSEYGVNTMCLPFDIKEEDVAKSPVEMTFCEYGWKSQFAAGTYDFAITIKELSSLPTVGKPVIMITAQIEPGKSWSISWGANDGSRIIQPNVASSANIKGSYQEELIGIGYYKPGNAYLTVAPTKASSTVKPFRAYIDAPWDPNKPAPWDSPKIHSISIIDSETTAISETDMQNCAISEIYSVDGTKLDELKKGVNIVRMQNGTTRKIMKY